MKELKSNGFHDIIAQAIEEMKSEQGENFSLDRINLAELERHTGVSRAKLRRLKQNGFADVPHALHGRRSRQTILTGYTAILNDMLCRGITNSAVCLARLQAVGFSGGRTTVKDYIASHKYLVPAKRQLVTPQGNRGRRFSTEPGETYQMDWGFANVLDYDGSKYNMACFATMCHQCGQRYIEFFPNAKQGSLYIGILYGFAYLGIPESVIKGRDVNRLKSLPSLSVIYAHKALAFIGPAGIGKPHLAQAFGYACCQMGIKTYFIKMTKLQDKFTAVRRSGKETAGLNGRFAPLASLLTR